MLRRIPIVVALIGAAAIATHAQRGGRSAALDTGLTPLNVGELLDASRVPGTPENRAKAITEAAIRTAGGRFGDAQPAVPGRVLVRFRSDATPAARAAAVRSVSRTGAIAQRPSYADFDLIRIDATDDPEAIAAALKAQHADVVENAQATYRWKTMFKPNDPLYSTRQWNLPYLNLEAAWDIQPVAGSDVIVAVIDTGMAYRSASFNTSIPAFTDGVQVYPPLNNVTIPFAPADQLVNASNASRIVAPYDFIWDDDLPLDFEGHGTHVAGTIGQVTNDNTGPAGVAFNVKLMPIKVLFGVWDYLLGAPNLPTDDVLARAIRYAVDHGARVLNMSLGRTTGGPAFVVEDALRYAVGRGAFVAIAAGNEYEEGNPVSILAEICSRINGAMSVAAIDRNRGHASYSTAGPYVEIAAPGGDFPTVGFAPEDGLIWQQTFNFNFTDTYLRPPSQYGPPRFDVFAYIPFRGTSMASPHVAGAAAILMQQGITSPAAIEEALRRTAVDLGAPGRDNFFGYGLVNVRKAMFGIGAAK
jgi:serine protease